MKNYFKSTIKLGIAILIIFGFIILTFRYFDAETIWKSTLRIIDHPILLVSIFVIYFISFYFKAIAWKLYLRGKARLSTCLIGIFYSLLVNHLLPIKIGDLLRIKILSTRDKQITNDEAFHSVFILRLLDLLSLVIMTLVGLVSLKVKFLFPIWMMVFSLILCITTFFLLNKYAPLFLNKHISLLKNALLSKNGLAIILFTLMSWILEAGVIYFTVMAISGELSIYEAVFANSVTIAGQVFQITPGGIANYESFLVFALNVTGISMKDGYTIAVLTHAIKFTFTYLVGTIILVTYPIRLQTIRDWIRVRGVSR